MRPLALLVLSLACQLTCLAALAAGPPAARGASAAPAGAFTVLCYHEVRDDVRDYPDPYAVDSAALAGQFAWLRGNGYVPVSLDQIIAARQGGKPLPAQAVLLTFDDGYISFYTRVYPLLREFGFPAVLGVVGKWIDSPRDGPVMYGEKGTVLEASFPTWSQLREMTASGLVEIASHTYDLHRGVPANPQGNLEPAATARIYDAATGTYEVDAAWRARVRADFARNAEVIRRETGRRPRAIVWPYGSYNEELVRIAGEFGISVALTLDDGINIPEVPLTALRRTLIEHNPALAKFATEVRGPLHPEPVRVVQVDLDDVYSTDPAQQERNLSLLLDRVEVLKPTHVFLQATADSRGAGGAGAAYFPNRHLALRADLFNRAAWQLETRNDVKVFAVMPMTGLQLQPNLVAEVYEDLARYTNIDGLVFEDRAQAGGPPQAPEEASVVEFTRQLAARARAFRAPLKTVRGLYAAMPDPAAPPGRFTQDFSRLAADYDYVAVMVAQGKSFALEVRTTTLAAGSAGRAPGNPDPWGKAIFMFQNSPEPSNAAAGTGVAATETVARQMRALQRAGALNFGYFHDDFLHNNPPLARIAPAMALRVYPLAPESGEK